MLLGLFKYSYYLQNQILSTNQDMYIDNDVYLCVNSLRASAESFTDTSRLLLIERMCYRARAEFHRPGTALYKNLINLFILS